MKTLLIFITALLFSITANAIPFSGVYMTFDITGNPHDTRKEFVFTYPGQNDPEEMIVCPMFFEGQYGDTTYCRYGINSKQYVHCILLPFAAGGLMCKFIQEPKQLGVSV